MKKTFPILTALSLIYSLNVHAQSHGLDSSKKEKFQTLKIAYLTEELSLTPEEAQAFWPLYNEMGREIQSVRKKRRKNRLTTKENYDQMSDAELEIAVDNELIYEQKELDLKKEYNERFKQILSIKKVALLQAAEGGFRKQLLRGARDKKYEEK